MNWVSGAPGPAFKFSSPQSFLASKIGGTYYLGKGRLGMYVNSSKLHQTEQRESASLSSSFSRSFVCGPEKPPGHFSCRTSSRQSLQRHVTFTSGLALDIAVLKDRTGIWSSPVGCICENQRKKYDRGQRGVIKISKRRTVQPRAYITAKLSRKSYLFHIPGDASGEGRVYCLSSSTAV